MIGVLIRFLWRVRFQHVDGLVMEDVVCLYLLDKAKQLNDALGNVTSDPKGTNTAADATVGVPACVAVPEHEELEVEAKEAQPEPKVDVTAIDQMHAADDFEGSSV